MAQLKRCGCWAPLAPGSSGNSHKAKKTRANSNNSNHTNLPKKAEDKKNKKPENKRDDNVRMMAMRIAIAPFINKDIDNGDGRSTNKSKNSVNNNNDDRR